MLLHVRRAQCLRRSPSLLRFHVRITQAAVEAANAALDQVLVNKEKDPGSFQNSTSHPGRSRKKRGKGHGAKTSNTGPGVSRVRLLMEKHYDSTPIYEPLKVEQDAEVPPLEHNLSRVLFQHGPQFLQDPRSKVYNFDPYLQDIIPLEDFNKDLILEYITSAKDSTMLKMSKELKTKYYSSTSSMTGLLSQLHFLLSNFRPVYLGDFTQNINDRKTIKASRDGAFTKGAKLACSVIVRQMGNGKYAIDSDKSADREIILSQLGHVLERLLTSKPEFFEKFKTGYKETLPELEKNAYQYSKMGKFLLRSQLDCKDDRLPGNGTFDLKTRAVCAVRHDMIKNQYDSLTGYEINKLVGSYESFEKELYELSKSTLLKYSLQARIGNMDGIFVAYHNISRMFGFEYLPLQKIDKILHNVTNIHHKDKYSEYEDHDHLSEELSTKWANDEFNISMKIINDILDIITSDFLLSQSFRLCFKTYLKNENLYMDVIAAPITTAQLEEIQNSGYKSTELLLEEVDEVVDRQEHMDKYIEKMKALNQSTTENSIGFTISVTHEINYQTISHDEYPRYESLDDKLKTSVEINKMSFSKHAQNIFIGHLNEKLNMLSDNTVQSDDEVDSYIKILRSYGKKGELRRALEEKENNHKVWNKD